MAPADAAANVRGVAGGDGLVPLGGEVGDQERQDGGSAPQLVQHSSWKKAAGRHPGADDPVGLVEDGQGRPRQHAGPGVVAHDDLQHLRRGTATAHQLQQGQAQLPQPRRLESHPRRAGQQGEPQEVRLGGGRRLLVHREAQALQVAGNPLGKGVHLVRGCAQDCEVVQVGRHLRLGVQGPRDAAVPHQAVRGHPALLDGRLQHSLAEVGGPRPPHGEHPQHGLQPLVEVWLPPIHPRLVHSAGPNRGEGELLGEAHRNLHGVEGVPDVAAGGKAALLLRQLQIGEAGCRGEMRGVGQLESQVGQPGVEDEPQLPVLLGDAKCAQRSRLALPGAPAQHATGVQPPEEAVVLLASRPQPWIPVRLLDVALGLQRRGLLCVAQQASTPPT